MNRRESGQRQNISAIIAGGIRRARRLGVFHKIGYARVWCRCRLFPLPPWGKFPSANRAARKPPGLVALGGILTPETLLEAYSQGIFPYYYKYPIKWISCDPRMVLFLENMKLKKGLRPLINSGRYTVTFDTAFEEVVKRCSQRVSTWLFPERIEVAVSLHKRGLTHSVEVWNQEGNLVGGLFGLDMGLMFISESAFSEEKGTMRIATTYLNCHLQHWGYRMNDAWAFQEHFRRLGYELIPRKKYLNLLPELIQETKRRVGKWSVDSQLNVGTWIPSEPGSQLVQRSVARELQNHPTDSVKLCADSAFAGGE